MAHPALADDILLETLRVFYTCDGNKLAAASALGIPRPTFVNRLARANERFPDYNPEKTHPQSVMRWTYPAMKHIDAPATTWIIGSDFHVWDTEPSLVYKAFIKLAKELKVHGIIMNGDVIDGARISRHGLNRGTAAPKISKEIAAAVKLLKMLPNAQQKLWTMGNHDIRLDNYITSQAKEIEDLASTLPSTFPNWEFAYAFTINEHTEVRHRFRGGIHGGYNNALHSGINVITGHTHQLQVTAVRDRRGSRWGVETGTLADPKGPQFEYTEGAPTRAQMGFAVVSFDADGYMLPPELCEIIRGRPVFRGRYVM